MQENSLSHSCQLVIFDYPTLKRYTNLGVLKASLNSHKHVRDLGTELAQDRLYCIEISASYSEVPEFKSRTGRHLTSLRFPRFSPALPGKY
jgi:hypothetical protein